MEKENAPRPKIQFNVKKYLKLCLTHWKLVGSAMFIFLILGVLFSMWRQPSYQVDAQVMLPPEISSPGIIAEMASSFSMGDLLGTSSTTDNEMDVMRSHSVFLATAKELGLNVTVSERQNPLRWVPLYIKAPFKVTMAEELCDTLSSGVYIQLKRVDQSSAFDVKVKCKKKVIYEEDNVNLPATLSTSWGTFTVTPTEHLATSEASRFRIAITSFNGAAEAYQQLVKIFIPNKKTDFIGLTVNTAEPQFGELLLATIIKNYNQVGIDQKAASDSRTLSFINERLESLTQELATSERDIESFKSAHNLTEPEADVNVLLQKSANIEAELLAAETENEILAMTYDFVNNPANNYSLIPGVGGPSDPTTATGAVAGSIDKYNELVLERMRILNSAKGNNASLRTIEDQLDAMHANIVSSVGRAYSNSKVRLAEVSGKNNETQSRLGTVPALEREYLGLARIQRIQEQLYLFLLKQKEETSMSLVRTNPSTLVIDAPHTIVLNTTLTTPKVLAIFLFLGMIVGMLIVFLRKYQLSSVDSLADFMRLSRIPLLGIVKKTKGSDLATENQGLREEFRALRHNLRHLLSEVDGKVMLVTATREGDGKSFVAANLASTFSLLDKRTVVVDADMRHPSLASIFNLSTEGGLSSYLAGKVDSPTIATVATSDGRALDVITAGSASDISTELLGSERMQQLMHDLAADYDYIVLDSPATYHASDPFELARYASITVYVARAGRTSMADIEFANSLYDDGRLPRLAMVVDGLKSSENFSANATTLATVAPEA